MNGVNIQVSTMTTVAIGCSVLHDTSGRPTCANAQLSIPMLVSNIEYFQISDAAAGMMRNGVIIRVRAMARPRQGAVEQDGEQQAEQQGEHHREAR